MDANKNDVERIQKKALTRWLNSQLQPCIQPVQDLYTDLSDGTILTSLLHTLTKGTCQMLLEEASFTTDADHAVGKVVQFLHDTGCELDENIHSAEIVSGDGLAIRQLVWSIVQQWLVKKVACALTMRPMSQDSEKVLLTWCQQRTAGYRGVDVHDFTSSWRDGLAFNALIHSYHPDWFDYESLAKQTNHVIIEHAFHCAHTKLNVSRILDCQDVEADVPDKKSIMMYVAMYCEALCCDQLSTLTNMGSMTSLVSSASMITDINVFTDSLETVLRWLYDASETMKKQSPVAGDIEAMKDQFHQHEEFMVKLTHKQTSVGNILHDGSCLLQQPNLSATDQQCVNDQLTLLSNRWEELRLLAMDRQARLQHALVDLQQQQLDQLSDWLNQMEARINSTHPVGGDEQSINHQLEEHQLLQVEVEQQQDHVASLHNMVVVVDETNAESAYAAMEGQLESLGIRWANVCRWMEERSNLLSTAALKWRSFSERLKAFMAWLSDTNDVLSDIEKHWASDDVNIADNNSSNAGDIIEQVQCLKVIEGDMDVMIKYFDELNDIGIQVVQYIGGDDASVQAVNTQLQDCQEKWDSLVQRMELCSKQIANAGIELVVTTTASGSQTVTVSRSGMESVTFSVGGTSAGSSKRPQLESLANLKKEFDRQVAALSEWLDQTEGMLELLTSETADTQDRLTVEEQLVLIEDAECDIQGHEQSIEDIKVAAENLKKELATANEIVEPVDTAVRRLESRWSSLKERLKSNKETVSASNVMAHFCTELEALRNIISVYDSWAAGEGRNIGKDFIQLSQQLEQCRVKQKSLLSHESRISKLNEQFVDLHKTVKMAVSVEENFNQLNERWKSTIRRLNERHALLMKTLQKTPPKSFMDAFLELTDWITGREQSLNAVTFAVDDTAIMDRQVNQLKELRGELKDRAGSLDYINHAGQDLIRKAPSETEQSAQRLRDDLQNLNTRWSQLLAAIEERLKKYTSATDQLKHLRSQMDGVLNWIKEIEIFLTSEEAALGDIETLQAQLAESEGVQEDIHTMQPTVDGILSVSAVLRSHADPGFSNHLQTEIESMRTRWMAVIDLSKQHTAKLLAAIGDTRSFLGDISKLDTWLDDVTHAHLTREYTVHTEAELVQFTNNFQRLEAELKSSRELELERVREKVNGVVNAAGQGGAVELAAALSRLEAKFVDIKQQIIANSEKFQTAGENLSKCRALTDDETKWLDELEAKLSKGLLRTSADAEELSEELDDLESYLSKRDADVKSQIMTLTQSLLNDHVMVALVTSNLDVYISRLQRTLDEAKHRIEQLEEAIVQAQARETQIVEMSQWMSDVNELLQTRLDADVLASDTPKEFESLKAEFDQHDTYMLDLEKDVVTFREQGKLEAAKRLENQLALLKKHYAEVMAKFIKFQRPSDFDMKMGHVKHLLEEIEERLNCLEISSSEPDDIQNQLDQCMKFYKAMSEAKSEVEYVIKTGRQIVEKKQVDIPEQLNTQIDSIKLLYNELGAQVTQGKTSLEQALKLAKKLKKESVSLREFMASTNKELAKREVPAISKDIEEELIWVKTTATELNKKQPVLAALGDIVGQLTKMSDENIMAPVDVSVRQLADQLNELIEHMNSRKTSLQENVEHLEQLYVEFETMQREVVIWLDNAEDILSEFDKLSEDTELTEEDTTKFKTLQSEHNQLVSQVDSIRDSAVEIISHSARYSKTVEPLLTLLNQRWQEVSTKLKEKQTFFRESSLKNKKTPSSVKPSPVHQTGIENFEFEVLVAKVISTMNEFEDNVTKCDITGSNEQLFVKLRELDDAESEIEKELTSIQTSVNNVLPELQKTNPENAESIIRQMEQLKTRHELLLEASQNMRLSISRVVFPEFIEFIQLSDDITSSLTDIELRLAVSDGDTNKLVALNDEVNSKQAEIEQLNNIACDLPVDCVFIQVKVTEVQNNIKNRMQKLHQQLTLFPTDGFSSCLSSAITTRVTDLHRLKIEPIVFVAQPTQYLHNLELLEKMAGIVEEEAKMPLVQDYKFDFINPQEDEIKILEDAVSSLQTSVDSAISQQDTALASSSQEERTRVQNRLKCINIQLKDLLEYIAERKQSEDMLLSSMNGFTMCMEDLTIWLTETESVINERVNFADGDHLEKLLAAVKEREISLGSRRQQLRILSNSGHSMYYAVTTSAEDRTRISHDLTRTVESWNTVVSMIPKKMEVLEEKLLALTNLFNLLDKLAAYIPSVILRLEQINAEPNHGEDINKVVNDLMTAGQTDADEINRIYSVLKSDTETFGDVIPEDVQMQVNDVCTEWAALCAQTADGANTSCHEEIELVESRTTAVVCSAGPDNERLFELNISPWSDLDNECTEFLQVVKPIVIKDEKQVITIGNIEETEHTIKNMKSELGEIETKYNQLMTKCNEYKLNQNASSDDQALLDSRVAQLKTCVDQAKLRINRRCESLEDMLLECRQFDQMVEEFDRCLSAIEEDCENLAAEMANASSVSAIEQLLVTNKKLETEVLPWQSKVSSLQSMTDKLVDGYPDDNSANIKATVNKLDHRYTTLSLRLAAQERQLQTKMTSLSRFDTDLKDFLLWLTKIEVVLMHHEETTINDSSCTDNDRQRNKLQNTFRELQADIDSRRSTVQSLNATGNIIVHGTQTAAETEMIQEQLRMMNERWNKVNERSTDLRSRLEIHTRPSNELLDMLMELTTWLRNVNDEISSKSQIVGDTVALLIQGESSQAIRDRLEAKRSQVENCVRDARMCRADDPASRRSSAICVADSNAEPSSSPDIVVALDAAVTEHLASDIRSQADVLYRLWINTSERVRDWQQLIGSTTQKVQSMENALGECNLFVMSLEKEASGWQKQSSMKPVLNQLQAEYTQTKSFQRDVRTVESKVIKFRTTIQTLQKEGITLSPNILGTLDKLDTRMQTLFMAASNRLEDLTHALKQFGPSTQHILLQSVEYPWERSLKEPNKVPYYVNHGTEQTQWDHPEMTEIIHSLAEKNNIKFSAYRTSLKLRLLQKQLKFELIELSKVLEELDRQSMTSYSNRQLAVSEIVSCLILLLTNTLDNNDQTTVDISVCTDLILNWLLNVYDQARSGKISMLSYAVAVILMCKGHLEDKCRAIFHLVSDANGHVTEHRLNVLLRECIQIPRQLGEIAAFGGSNVEPSVRSCFEKAGNKQEIEASHFVDWMKMEPQSMVWLPVMHRFAAAETARHQAKCRACKECPIVGFRYRCLKCFHFDMCQNCFFAGRKAKSHKLTHPMQEYCTVTTSGEDVRDFTKMFKNKFRTKRYFKKHPRLGYLPVQTDLDGSTLDRRSEVRPTNLEAPTTSTATPAITSHSGSSTPSNASLRVTFRLQPETSCVPPPFGQQNSNAAIEMHMRLELYANRLAEVEKKRRESTPDWEDEHSLIAQYCQTLHGTNSTRSLQSPMQIMLAVDADQKLELETMIRDLEDENRALQCEYDQLKQAHMEQLQNSAYGSEFLDDVTDDVSQNGGDVEMMAEARLLRQHKGRLEARMRILEEHNEQLDAQLKRLRHLLNNGEQSNFTEVEARILTYPQTTTPSELSNASSHSSLPRRGPPPSFSSSAAIGRSVSNDDRRLHGVQSDSLQARNSMDDEYIALLHDNSTNEQTRGSNTSNINDLLQVAGEVGKAVKSLVTIMTDEEQDAHDEIHASSSH